MIQDLLSVNYELEEIELSIFRIVQEGLSNVRKHANASDVMISLNHTTPRTLLLSIADNGTGLAEGFELSDLPVEGMAYWASASGWRSWGDASSSRIRQAAGC